MEVRRDSFTNSAATWRTTMWAGIKIKWVKAFSSYILGITNEGKGSQIDFLAPELATSVIWPSLRSRQKMKLPITVVHTMVQRVVFKTHSNTDARGMGTKTSAKEQKKKISGVTHPSLVSVSSVPQWHIVKKKWDRKSIFIGVPEDLALTDIEVQTSKQHEGLLSSLQVKTAW